MFRFLDVKVFIGGVEYSMGDMIVVGIFVCGGRVGDCVGLCVFELCVCLRGVCVLCVCVCVYCVCVYCVCVCVVWVACVCRCGGCWGGVEWLTVLVGDSYV